MSIARYLSKLGALLNSSGQVQTSAIANTAVTRAKMASATLGNLTGHTAIGSNTTLTSVDAGKVFSVSTAGLAIQINTSGLSVGDRFMFIGNGGGATLTRTDGGNFYSLGALTTSSITFSSAEGVSLYWDGGGLIIENFSLNLKWSANFAASLGGSMSSGYQKLPSGLIIQWGVLNSHDAVVTTVTLPITFPSAIFSITGAQSAQNGAAQYRNGWSVVTTGLSSFTVKNETNGNNNWMWIALGN